MFSRLAGESNVRRAVGPLRRNGGPQLPCARHAVRAGCESCVMPSVDWGTVLASGTLSALLSGGITLAGQRWQRRFEREETMRERMVQAADGLLLATARSANAAVDATRNLDPDDF